MTSMAHAGGMIQLPQTGQTVCYDTAGVAINCIGTGQDGELQIGAAWPNPRFTVVGNELLFVSVFYIRENYMNEEITS